MRRVLVFGTYDVRSHPRVGVLAAGLQRHRFDVRQLNAPLGVDTAGRVAALQDPRRLPTFLAVLARRWAVLVRRALALRLRGVRPDAVLVGYLGHFDVLLARALFPRTRILLDHLVSASDTARDRGESGGVKQALLRALDTAALACADVVIVDTEEHRDALPVRSQPRAVVVPVGAPDGWFQRPRLRPAGPLRVVFFGLFTPLQGAPVVARALAAVADDEVVGTMVGHGQDLAAAHAAAGGTASLSWLEWVAPDELPALVADHDVCLGIFGTGAKALRVVPNKVFQGAAAGCTVVTSDTPPQRRALADAAVLVPPGDAVALAAALRHLARHPEEVAARRVAAYELAERAFRAEQVIVPLVAALGGAPRRKPRWQDAPDAST